MQRPIVADKGDASPASAAGPRKVKLILEVIDPDKVDIRVLELRTPPELGPSTKQTMNAP
jgi:hypothetical protein